MSFEPERKKYHSIKDEAQAVTEQCGVYFSPYELEIFSRKATEIIKVLNKPCGITMNYQRIGVVMEIVEKSIEAGTSKNPKKQGGEAVSRSEILTSGLQL